MEVDEKLYFLVRDSLEVFSKLNNRLDVSGMENIPLADGALLCPCHDNFSDPFFVAAAVRGRPLHFLAWHAIADMPLVGPLLKSLGAMHSINESYGVANDKEQAREVLGELEGLLKEGELCVVFPEGRIKHWLGPGEMAEFKTGAVRLAARAGVPIIPVGLTGSRWVVPNIINLRDYGGPDWGVWIPMALPAKVRVRFSEPFHVDPAAASDKDVAREESERLRRTLIRVVEEMEHKKHTHIMKKLTYRQTGGGAI